MLRFALRCLPVVLLFASVALSQVSPDLEQGMKPYGSYHGGAIDQVSLTNQNLILQANLFTYSQRGGELAYPIVLRYNNKNFSLYQTPCAPGTKLGTTQCPLRLRVVFGPAPLGTPSVSHGASVTVGFDGLPTVGGTRIDTSLTFDGSDIFVSPASVVTPDGSVHQLVQTNNGMITVDGSGYSSPGLLNATDRNGTTYAGGALAEDRSGNKISLNNSTWTDTLGRQIPAAPGPASPSSTPPASTASLGACPALNYANQPVVAAYSWGLPTINGGTLPLILCYSSVYVRTNILGGAQGPNNFDVSQTFYMLQSVVMPDNTYWAFQYDAADPNNTSSFGFADLLKVTLPTGGSLTYTWIPSSFCESGYSRAVQTRAVDANDGTGPHTWTYSGSVVTDPAGNDTVHTITGLGGTCSLYETQTQYYQGPHNGGTLLKTVNTDYQYTSNPYDSAVIGSGGVPSGATTVTNVYPIRVTTTLPTGLVSKVETDYDTALAYHGPLDGITTNVYQCQTDPTGQPVGCFYGDQSTIGVTNYTGSYGKVVATREYDWGQGAPGTLLRRTVYSYQWQNGPNAASYLSNNLLDLVSSTTVYDGAGNQVASTTYGYDESSLGSSGVGSTLRDPNPPNGSLRGNQTTVSHWLNTSNTFLSSHATYNDAGEVLSSTDPGGHTTNHLYDLAYQGAYSTQSCSPTTNPGSVTHCVSGTYDFNTGLLTSLTNENATQQASGSSPGDAAHTSNFSYDSYWRIFQALAPPDTANGSAQASTTFTYPPLASSPKIVTRQKSITQGLMDTASSTFDGLGRPYLNDHVTPSCTAEILTTYDVLGRAATVTNPYCSGTNHQSDPTYGVTQTQFDALGRVTQVTKQDGSIASVSYSGNCTTATDEAGKQRKSCSDALGRLVEIDEPPAGGAPFQNNHATVQSDGNFVLANSANAALWSTGTAGIGSDNFELQDDGNLVLYKFKWQAGTYRAWNGGSMPYDSCRTADSLFAGQILSQGQCLENMSNTTFALMDNGDLEIYDRQLSQITWQSYTWGNTGAYLTIQSDGNLVIYSTSGVALWSSGTSGSGANVATLENDGRLIMYSTVWSSGTAQGQASGSMTHPSCDLGWGIGYTGAMGTGQCVVSRSGRFELPLQSDGNLVLYDRSVTPNAALWSTGTAVTAFSPGVVLQTLYAYDALGNLTCVEQHGNVSGTGCAASPTSDATSPWRVRRFTYDSLSRLLTAKNPESGTITYSYDADGNLLQKTSPAPNQTGTATQTISYCYDELHRVTGRGYGAQSCPLSSPVVSYVYDSGPNAKGHLTSLTDQAGAGSYAYDTLGRIASETRVISGVSKSMSYSYDLDGSLKTLTYPSGAVVTYTPDSAGRVLSAIDSGNSINYATAATYGPDSSLTGFVSGS
ncbi:MAG: hypothetical protein WA738_07670, partial [Candidatus Angelobacter sp.]